MKIQTIYRISEGILKGTEIEPFLGLVLVKYPHRKTPDAYVPPMKSQDKEIKTWHCCQAQCEKPDFEGNLDVLMEHLVLHKGRLVKTWNKRQQLQSPIPIVRIPSNEWEANPYKGGINDDRRLCVYLYIERLKEMLKQQGLEVS